MQGTIVIILMALLFAPRQARGEFPSTAPSRTETYESSQQCRNCHAEIYAQYNTSRHARSFTNPLFWAQYFQEVVPRAEKNPAYRPVARRCVFCHSPVLFMNSTALIRTPAQAFFQESGVTCDFCHTFDGYADDGSYRKDPSGMKQGPFDTDSSWHGRKSSFIRISEFCAACHNSANHLGAEVKVTYDEWRSGPYPDRFVTCQECHMSTHGYVESTKGEFNRGSAARLETDRVPQRDKLYTHQFPGGYSREQLQGTATVATSLGKTRLPDGRAILGVRIDNTRSGHKLPSGSTDLRIVWLEVTARAFDGRDLPVRHLRGGKNGGHNYGIAGATPVDRELLGSAVPEGSRVYRTIFVDREGNRTASFVDADRIAFDNRLGPAETRREQYTAAIPPGYDGQIIVRVRLCYLNAPPGFTRRLGLPDFAPVVIADEESTFSLAPPDKRVPAKWKRQEATTDR